MKSRPRKSDDSSMFWFVRIFVMLALGAVIIVGLGFLLPEERTAVKTTLIDAPLGRVYQIVTDVDRQATWRSDVKSVHVERRGELWAWTEDQNSGTTFTLEELGKNPPKQYEFKYVTSNGMRGRWAGEFVEVTEDRTKLTLTQTVVIENPLRRVSAYVLLNLDTVMDIYLGDLSRYATAPESTIDPLLRPTTPRPIPTVLGEDPGPSAPVPEATPAASATPTIPAAPSATPSPATPSPALTPPLEPTPLSPSPTLPNPTLPTSTSVLTPPSTVSTSSSVTLPSPTTLPPNTPSLLTPSASPASPAPLSTTVPTPTPSATPKPTVTPTATPNPAP